MAKSKTADSSGRMAMAGPSNGEAANLGRDPEISRRGLLDTCLEGGAFRRRRAFVVEPHAAAGACGRVGTRPRALDAADAQPHHDIAAPRRQPADNHARRGEFVRRGPDRSRTRSAPFAILDEGGRGWRRNRKPRLEHKARMPRAIPVTIRFPRWRSEGLPAMAAMAGCAIFPTSAITSTPRRS